VARVRGLGLVVHTGRPVAVAAAARVHAWAEERGIHVADLDVWAEEGSPRRHAADEVAVAGPLDVIVTIGGDGTFLRGVRVASHADAVVLGVNVGRVGFLTEVSCEEVLDALEAYVAGTALVEERMTLTVSASQPLHLPEGMDLLLRASSRGPVLPPPKPLPRHGDGVPLDVIAVSVALYLDGKAFASYSADALVVASPTGSTAYSFAAGGPIVSPRLDAIVFTPVAPHMVFDRSIVLAGDEVAAVKVLPKSGPVAVSVDGQLRGVLDPGDWMEVRAAPWRARLVRLHRMDFYGRMRERFGLSDAPAAIADGVIDGSGVHGSEHAREPDRVETPSRP
jgi:NAD+ kinase